MGIYRKRGISIMEKGKTDFLNYSKNYADPESLSFNSVNCFYEDKKHDMWLGIYKTGADLIMERNFAWFRQNSFSDNSISNNNITFFVMMETIISGLALMAGD